MRRTLLFWILGFALVGSLRAQPATDVSWLLRHVEVLAADALEGRGAGTPGGAKARSYIVKAFEEIGLRPAVEGYTQPFSFATHKGDSVSGVNVLGYIEGTERPDSFIVVTAHYDHLGIKGGSIYNGADDNASGVAGLLALARYFQHNTPRHSMLFAALDAEELGLRGAVAFLKDAPVPRTAIELNVNLDMISRNEKGELFAAGTFHYPELRPVLERVAARSTVTLRFGHDRPDGSAGDDWTLASDHGPFHKAGIPFVYFGVEDHPDYHRPTDDYERIDPDFFARAVTTIIAAVTELDRSLEDVFTAPATPVDE